MQAALLVTIPLTWWLGVLSLPVLMLIVIGDGTASVVNVAAAMALIRACRGQHLQRAHARIDGADAVGSIAGPAVGRLVVSAFGAHCRPDRLPDLHVLGAHMRRIPPRRTGIADGVTVRGLLGDVADGVRWAYGGSGLRTLARATSLVRGQCGRRGRPGALHGLSTSTSTALQFGVVGAAGGVGALAGAAVTTGVGLCRHGRTIIVAHLITTIAVIASGFAGQTIRRLETMVVLGLGQGSTGGESG